MVKKTAAPPAKVKSNFHFDFLTAGQKLAWSSFDQHDILFLLGPAGVGKTHLAATFAISEILSKKRKKIVLTRPLVEAGESMGFLPGSFEEKINPFLFPLYDCIEACVGREGPQREFINRHIELAPVGLLRGRTFQDSICIFDEAQNATKAQLKLFLTRIGKNTKMIVTGDPFQSDLKGDVALTNVVNALESVPGIGVVHFKSNSIVRHPLIASILDKLD